MHREAGENYCFKCASCHIVPVSYKYHIKTPVFNYSTVMKLHAQS